jgi:hypothetical protein
VKEQAKRRTERLRKARKGKDVCARIADRELDSASMALKAGVDPPVVAPSLEVDSGWTVADKDKLRRRRGGRRKGAVVASVVGSRGGEERQIGVDGVEEEKEVLFPADPADVEDDGSLGQ